MLTIASDGTTKGTSLSMYADGSLIFPGTTALPVLLVVPLHRQYRHGSAGSFSVKL